MDTISSSMSSRHNHCFDFFKGVACVCVVFMHCEFPGVFGTAVQTMSRFCVPFFFMLSGYYSYYDNPKKYNAFKKISHIAKITLFASVFYLLVTLALHLANGSQLTVSLRSIINWLVFNQPFLISGHLWFLFALLYDYVLFSLVNKMKLTTLAPYMIVVLIVAYICLAQGAHLAGMKISNMFYRNFLIEGFPLFMLGYWLHSTNDKVTALFNDRILLFLLLLSTMACLGERMFLGRDLGVNISTFPQVFALFILGMKHPEKYENCIISRFGAKLSMLIYVLHIFVWRRLNTVYKHLHVSDNAILLYLKPILVLVITILLSMAITVCMEKAKQWIANRKKIKAE